jgi:hypothetical protein
MDGKERGRRAVERAEKYAPKPTGGSRMAGLCGAVVAAVGDWTISTFYGWSVREHILIASLTAVLGFLIGFLGYKRLEHLSRKARCAERASIDCREGDL